MTSVEKRDQIVTWDGNPATWTEYVKRVRFQYEKTEPRKRRLLGAELASRLTNRAWEVTAAEIDHVQLQRSDGAAYLLKFLEEKLCKAPIPDTGQRLEDMLIRLRRTPGSSMTEGATQVRETYRRLQRAMARQRRDSELRKAQLGNPGHTAPVPEQTQEAQRRRSDVTSPAQERQSHTPTGSQRFGNDGDDFSPNPVPEGDPGHEDAPEPNPDGYQQVPTSEAGSNPGHDEWWTREQWDDWYAQRRRWRDKPSDASTNVSWDDTEDVKVQWEQFDYGEMQILPEEILGWILLRRSGLPASARLSILSAINNCLDFSVMERAMRDQEELLMTEAQRSHGAVQRPRRSFWIESEGQWGLLAETELDEINENSIHWVGDHLPVEVYTATAPEPTDDEQAWVTQLPNGQELEWQWHDDDFYAMDVNGCF